MTRLRFYGNSPVSVEHLLLMNRIIINIFSFLWFGSAIAQTTCVRDSSIIGPEINFSPALYTDELPEYNLNIASIGIPYNQSLTINVPSQVEIPGGAIIPVSNISIASTNAISGLPEGLNYTCSPPNCIFSSLSLGCILITGTPAITNLPGTSQISIAANITSVLIVPVTLPQDLAFAPGSAYHLVLQADAPGINTSIGMDTVCAGNIFTIDYAATHVIFNSGNVFTAQLSDSAGNFDNAVDIGSLNGTSLTGQMNVAISSNQVAGNNYHIRINSSNPVITGSASGVLSIHRTNGWTGALNLAWENPGNWSCGKLPDASTDVVISTGDAVVGTTGICRTLLVPLGSGLTTNLGATFTVTP